ARGARGGALLRALAAPVAGGQPDHIRAGVGRGGAQVALGPEQPARRGDGQPVVRAGAGEVEESHRRAPSRRYPSMASTHAGLTESTRTLAGRSERATGA